jgi:hypothetical protein
MVGYSNGIIKQCFLKKQKKDYVFKTSEGLEKMSVGILKLRNSENELFCLYKNEIGLSE